MKRFLALFSLLFLLTGAGPSPCYWAGTVTKCFPVAGITHVAPASTASSLTLDTTASTNQNAQVVFKGNYTGPTAQTWNIGENISLTTGAFEVVDVTASSALKVSILPGTTGGAAIKGTGVNGDPTAGWVGEYKESKSTAGTNTGATNAYFDAGSITLTAGDWDCSGAVEYLRGTATFTAVDLGAGISGTTGNSATGLTVPVTHADNDFGGANLTFNNFVIYTPVVRVQSDGTNLYINAATISSVQVVYLKGYTNAYTGGPPTYKSFLRCRRPR